jgi:hypothetical protein
VFIPKGEYVLNSKGEKAIVKSSGEKYDFEKHSFRCFGFEVGDKSNQVPPTPHSTSKRRIENSENRQKMAPIPFDLNASIYAD